MCLSAHIRVLITTVVLASYSPLGHAIGIGDAELGRAGHLAVSLFLNRRTRVAASQHFDATHVEKGVAVEEVTHQRRDLPEIRFQQPMPAIEQVQLGVRQIA
jgi:hypothetical protein